MSESYRLPTPENVAVSYELAGVGSRFIAAAIDTLVQVILIILVATAIVLAGGFAMGRGALRDLDRVEPEGAAIWAVAILVVALFLLLWGYYVTFEMLWNGQSPGKRLTRLRVLRDTGYPVGFLDSLLRNLVRVVDFLPFAYGIGVVSMLIDSQSRRLGDLAAGTIVVKERRALRAVELATPVAGPAPAADGPGMANVARLTGTDYSVLREYLLRRDRLAAPARAALASELSATLAHRLAIAPPDTAAADAFLTELAAAYRERRGAERRGGE